VLRRRNTLSHALEEATANGWVIRQPGSRPDLTVNDFETFRFDFLAYRRNLERLRDLLIRQ
ncbi:MAG: hypothetical protein OXQ90_10655, partial [Gammaproteobacteria bacterium]|nr:hypothetical protein [Gammaproteobacteria bacterium]